MAVVDDRVVFVGSEADADAYAGADEVVDLEGRWVAPAFVDAHVHLVQTGFALTQLDLHEATSLEHALDLLAGEADAAEPGALVTAFGWDESAWPELRPPTREELDRAAGGRRVFLDRVDAHSSVLSTALVDAVPGLASIEGYDDGRVERDARHAVIAVLGGLIGPDQRLVAARAAARGLAAAGVAAFHDNAAPHIGPEYELEQVRQAARETGLHATLYWGALEAFEDADRLGVAGLAGDLNADGAFGSRTAALNAPYLDADEPDHCGHAYLDADTVARHVTGCTTRGLQAGFHCIGDAAMDAVSEGFRLAADAVGRDAVRTARHRVEHCELPSEEGVRLLADLGVVASVQPAFDDEWGGPDGMYAARLGERWREANRLADLDRAGVALAFGSDSPVTATDPWRAVRAAVEHRTPGQGVTPEVAFDAHTRGGWYAARIDDAGLLQPGQRASYAVWEGVRLHDGMPEPGETPTCVTTVAEGRVVYQRQES